MKAVTAAQMKEIDRVTIEQEGTSGETLMENAGLGCAEAVGRMLGSPAGKRVAIIAGKGNNGGDGFVMARLLAEQEAKVTVLLLGGADQVKGEARSTLDKLQSFVPVREISEAGQLGNLGEYDLIVDALLGTGLKDQVKEPAKGVIEAINRAGVPVFSVDTPSGLDLDTGQMLGVCVKADRTATMALPKIGLLLPPGKILAGALEVVDIGVPQSVIERQHLTVSLAEREEMAALLPVRAPDAHKGSCGRVAIAAGSTGMSGAAALCAEAALRSGAGMAILGIPEHLNWVMEIKLTEVMTRPLKANRAGSLGLAARPQIEKLVDWGEVFLLGPGLSLHKETVRLVKQLLGNLRKPTVIDADGLTVLAERPEVLKRAKADVILTPHIGEFARLARASTDAILADRLNLLRRFVKQHRAIVVLKGHPTVIADTNGDLYINSTGNAGMATAGAGDVLAGVIAGLVAQKVKPVDAARLGVYTHGLAGDRAREEKGEMGMIAGDILGKVPIALKSLKVGKD